jgi:hypothetical protein
MPPILPHPVCGNDPDVQATGGAGSIFAPLFSEMRDLDFRAVWYLLRNGAKLWKGGSSGHDGHWKHVVALGIRRVHFAFS